MEKLEVNDPTELSSLIAIEVDPIVPTDMSSKSISHCMSISIIDCVSSPS